MSKESLGKKLIIFIGSLGVIFATWIWVFLSPMWGGISTIILAILLCVIIEMYF
jgi:hypothetical protein